MTNLKHYLPHIAGAIVGSVAGWLAAGEFVARVAITDAIIGQPRTSDRRGYCCSFPAWRWTHKAAL